MFKQEVWVFQDKMWREFVKKALKELEEEGLIRNGRITKKGKKIVREMIKQDPEVREFIFKYCWNKLKNDFYEDDPETWALKLLSLDMVLWKDGICLTCELEKYVSRMSGRRA